MSPKGNRTGRGGTPRVGGQDSKGTIQKAIRLSAEMWKQLVARQGKNFSFSDYVRQLIERDLQTTK
jgi:hypothetical protein